MKSKKIKTRKFFIVGLIAILFSGCVVYSFFPLYTEEDLFANDILTGEWFESDEQEVEFSEEESVWTFNITGLKSTRFFSWKHKAIMYVL